MEKSCPITKTLTIQESPRSSIKLLIDSIKVFELDPSTIEPLSQESYSSLISHYSSSSKHFIIALVKSRDLENPTHLFSFCFDAYQLNKLLFKVKPNQELISRHDRLSPISASNPLTNLPIIGEVEYFLMKSPEMAEFIGTDYTFTQLSTLRNIFETNALRQEDMKFPLYTGHVDNLSSFALIDSNSLVLLERVIEGHRGSLLSQIRVPFKKAVPFGGLIVLYFMVLWLVLFIAGGKVTTYLVYFRVSRRRR